MPSRVVLITGCTTGIGYDVAQRLTRANYMVIATARHAERLSDLPVALQLPLDVTDPTSIASATEEVVRRFGRIDVLVNNAGYAVRGAVEDISVEQVQQMFDVNVYGVMRMIRAVVPHMRQQKSGRVITIGSLAGKLVLPVNGTYREVVAAPGDHCSSETGTVGTRAVAPVKRNFPLERSVLVNKDRQTTVCLEKAQDKWSLMRLMSIPIDQWVFAVWTKWLLEYFQTILKQ